MTVIKFEKKKKVSSTDILVLEVSNGLKSIIENSLQRLDYETLFGSILLITFDYIEQMAICLPEEKRIEFKRKMIDVCLKGLSDLDKKN